MLPMSIVLFAFLFSVSDAANINIVNKCPYTLWPAAVPGGGAKLNSGETWNINLPAGTTGNRVWARTGCTFDDIGRGKCTTGDCAGLLACNAYGSPPNTVVEFALNQFNNFDFFDISLIDGFNVPVDLSPNTEVCRGTRCSADIVGQCPSPLRAPEGCNNPCTVFKTEQYCCTSTNCEPTEYTRFFKNLCPDAYNGYPNNEAASTLTCTRGTNYTITFCP